MEVNYVWIFYVQDSGLAEKIHITIMSDTYDGAVDKIKAMKIPYLKTWSNIKDALTLEEVYEVEPDEDQEHHII